MLQPVARGGQLADALVQRPHPRLGEFARAGPVPDRVEPQKLGNLAQREPGDLGGADEAQALGIPLAVAAVPAGRPAARWALGLIEEAAALVEAHRLDPDAGLRRKARIK